MIPPVRSIQLGDIEAARERIAGTVLRTPLVRFDERIWLKLENLQPTNAYKIRGASNAVARLSDEERAKGVWTISAGNAGQGVAYAARQYGVPCTVVAIETAPQTKLDRMRALGAEIVPVSYERAWVAAESHEFPGLDATFVHPFDNHDFIAGHGTMGLEILEDLPDLDAVLIPWGGGGLTSGIASALKQQKPGVRVISCEPETGAPLAASLPAGESKSVDFRASFVDGSGSRALLPKMWGLAQELVDEAASVSLDETAAAVRLLAERARVVAEGAGALSLAAARAGHGGNGKLVCIVSGGNIDSSRLTKILSGETPA